MGYALSAACLAWVLHGYQFNDLVPAIRSLDWRWVALAVLSDLSAYVVQGWRWNTLLAPVAKLKLWRTVQAIYIGLFANEILPLHVGEPIRCYLLAHWNRLRLSVGFASAGVERVIDGFWMLTAFLITIIFAKGVPRKLALLVLIPGLLVFAGAATLAWVVTHKEHAHAVIRESRWAVTLRHVIEVLQLMGNRRTLGVTSLISLLCLLLQYFTVYALMKAYVLDYSFWVAAGVWTIMQLGTAVPNAPGNIGVASMACFMAMKLFELDEHDARTFSLILPSAQALPLLIGGAVATALTGMNIGELHDRARRGWNETHSTSG
jgi:hypothetical protein